MAVSFQIKERRLIPNWRDYKRTLQIGELHTYGKSSSTPMFDISRPIEDWKFNPNIGTAADLVNSAFVSGITNEIEIKEAIQLIRSNSDKASQTLIELANKLVQDSFEEESTSNILLERQVEGIREIESILDNRVLHKIIQRTKLLSKSDLHNPINWVELSRLYTIKGQEEKALLAMQIALNLNPNNRFVLRSATRLFVHAEEYDKALYYLRKSSSIKKDPWLISAHIATSSLIGRYSPLIKEGNSLLDSKNFHHYDLTELASSLGTLEIKNGTFKKATKLLTASLQSPNDNTLAQLEWISKIEPRIQVDPFKFRDVINPFEAYAMDHYDNGNWKDTYLNCINWLLDMPFSKRPIIMGSYIAGSLLKDNDSAITLCKVGLEANHNDPMLLNNLVYYSLKSGILPRDCTQYIQQLTDNLKYAEQYTRVHILATLGFAALTDGNIDLGKQLYEKSIEEAGALKNQETKNLAMLYYTEEMHILNTPGKEKYHKEILKLKPSNYTKTFNAKLERVLSLIYKDGVA